MQYWIPIVNLSTKLVGKLENSKNFEKGEGFKSDFSSLKLTLILSIPVISLIEASISGLKIIIVRIRANKSFRAKPLLCSVADVKPGPKSVSTALSGRAALDL